MIPGEEHRKAVDLILAIYESARTRQEVLPLLERGVRHIPDHGTAPGIPGAVSNPSAVMAWLSYGRDAVCAGRLRPVAISITSPERGVFLAPSARSRRSRRHTSRPAGSALRVSSRNHQSGRGGCARCCLCRPAAWSSVSSSKMTRGLSWARIACSLASGVGSLARLQIVVTPDADADHELGGLHAAHRNARCAL